MPPKRTTRASTTPKKEKETEKNDKTPVKKAKFENSWMFLSKDTIFPPNSVTSIITLKHPGLMTPAKFLINKSAKKIYELQTYKEPHRSWLIGETVKSDGSIQITTPVDPIFIILPHLKSQCMTRAIPLEQLLVSSKDDDLSELTDLITNLNSVADLKGPKDLCAYKYNEEKALKWLQAKVRRVETALKEEKIHVKSGSAVSASFVTSSLKQEDEDDESYLKYAHGIVSEYLQEDLNQLLYNRFNFKAEVIAKIGNKRKSEPDNADKEKNKKVKKENAEDIKENIEEVSETAQVKSEFFTSPKQQTPAKPAVLTIKEKQLQKAASGSKNIMSFFGKKK